MATLGSIVVPLKIDFIVEEVKIFVIPDGYVKEPVLVGMTFTEKEGIIAVKDGVNLTFYKRDADLKIISLGLDVKKITLCCFKKERKGKWKTSPADNIQYPQANYTSENQHQNRR